MTNRPVSFIDICLALLVVAVTAGATGLALYLTAEPRLIGLVLMPLVVVGSAFALYGEWSSKAVR